MPNLAANDILKVVVALAYPDSVVAQNIFWILFDGDGTSLDVDDVLDDLETWVEAMYAIILSAESTQVSLDDMTAYVYDASEDDFDEVGSRTVTGVGTSAVEYLPQGIAVVQNGNTVDADVQGRKFWGGLTEATQDDGGLAAGQLANFAALGLEWVSPFIGADTGSGFTPGVYSLTKSAFKNFSGVVATNLTMGYQRRRKPGVGI